MTGQQKSLLGRYHAEILESQKRIRALVATAGLSTELEDDPETPETVEDLSENLHTVRTNLFRVEIDLNELDRTKNGPETRTIEEIEEDISSDESLLAGPLPVKPARTRTVIERNIGYDRHQLSRNRP